MGVAKFQNKLKLRLLIRHIVSKFQSPCLYSLQVMRFHTDKQAKRLDSLVHSTLCVVGIKIIIISSLYYTFFNHFFLLRSSEAPWLAFGYRKGFLPQPTATSSKHSFSRRTCAFKEHFAYDFSYNFHTQFMAHTTRDKVPILGHKRLQLPCFSTLLLIAYMEL